MIDNTYSKTINIALLIEYDGSLFSGFQKQNSHVTTVQGELETALFKFANQPIKIIAAGRTDAGVHALYQVVNFTTELKRELHSWQRGVNTFLPRGIIVREAQIVAADFNARFSALSRTYHYYLCIEQTKPAILVGKVGFYHDTLDAVKVKQALMLLIGTQDFSSFRAANCQAAHPLRTISTADLVIKNNMLRFTFTANAFLYHMVRNLVGALVYVGNGRLSLNDFQQLIMAKNRSAAPPTFMPDGLYLAHVEYRQTIFAYKIPEWFV